MTPIFDWLKVSRASTDLVADARQILYPAAANEHLRVLLKIVSLARDIGGDLFAIGEADADHLAISRVRLLRVDDVGPKDDPP